MYGTNMVTHQGKEIIGAINRTGGKVYFLTARTEDNQPEHLNLAQTHLALKELGIQYELVLGDVPSPRVLINDEGATAYNVQSNSGLNSRISPSIFANSIHDALEGLAWVNSKFGKPGGSDDFVQTILIAESLIQKSGFCHADIVHKLRSSPPITMNGEPLSPGGLAPKRYKGQMWKLINSTDSLYQAEKGVSDGAAMRTLGIGAFYTNNFEDLVCAASEIASITHGSVEARLSSVLTALRYRQIFSQDVTATPSSLFNQLARAVRILKLGNSADFFLDRANTAAIIATRNHHPSLQLFQLSKYIGIDHLCWSTPIAATFWSFHSDDNYNKWFKGFKLRSINIPPHPRFNKNMITIDSNTYLQSQRDKDMDHLKSTNEYEDFVNCHGYHYGKWIDNDTFFSIAISMLSGRLGTKSIFLEVERHLRTFNVDMRTFAYAFSDCLFRESKNISESKEYDFYL